MGARAPSGFPEGQGRLSPSRRCSPRAPNTPRSSIASDISSWGFFWVASTFSLKILLWLNSYCITVVCADIHGLLSYFPFTPSSTSTPEAPAAVASFGSYIPLFFFNFWQWTSCPLGGNISRACEHVAKCIAVPSDVALLVWRHRCARALYPLQSKRQSWSHSAFGDFLC